MAYVVYISTLVTLVTQQAFCGSDANHMLKYNPAVRRANVLLSL